MVLVVSILAATHLGDDKPKEQDHQENYNEARPSTGFEDRANGVAAANSQRQSNEAESE